MLEHLGEDSAGRAVEKAVMKITEKNIKSLAAGQMGLTTTQVGDLVAKHVTE